VWTRGSRPEDVAGVHVLGVGAPLEEIPVFKLIECLEAVLRRAKVSITHDVVVERVSITDRIHTLVERLEREGTFTFESCFDFVAHPELAEPGALKYHVVVTLLAVLEMTRLKMLRITQAVEGGMLYLTRAAGDLSALLGEKTLAQSEEYKG
jgi:segregation and condensation protein A